MICIGKFIMVRCLTLSRLGLCLFAAVLIQACGRDDREALKMPLDQSMTAGAGGATTGMMAGEAKAALDSGNVLFRARDHDGALAQYRISARLAPAELAPLLGILMVADVTGNATLADSTMRRMRELDPAAAEAAAAMSHSEIIEGHPR